MTDESCDAPHLASTEAAARRDSLTASRTVEAIAETFRVLGDPTRVRILDALSGGELCVCDIAALAGISESAVSHQLRLLRGMRLVRPRRAGRQVFYSLDDQHIVQLLRLAITHVEEPGPGADASPRSRAPVAAGGAQPLAGPVRRWSAQSKQVAP